MNELQVRISPTSVPCSSSADPADNPVPIAMQISVINVGGQPVDLSAGALRFELSVDNGGDSSAQSLILSDHSVTPATTLPVPAATVLAAPVAGTAWTITPVADGTPCAFMAVPLPRSGVVAPQGGVSFVFSNVLVDLVPGAAPITVTVLPMPPDGPYSTTGPAFLLKTKPGLGILGFGASPILVNRGDQSDLTWTTIGAAACTLSWFPGSASTVKYNDTLLTNPAMEVPLQVDGTAPVEVTVNAQTEFVLVAQGASSIRETVVVDVAEPALYFSASDLKVLPGQQFVLEWSAFGVGAPPAITWLTAGVQMTDNATGQPVVTGQQLASSQGSATVEILQPTEFTIEVPTKSGSLTIDVFTTTLVSVVANPDVFTGPGPDSDLVVTFANATGLRIFGPWGTQDYLVPDPQGGKQQELTYKVVSTTVTADYLVEAIGYPGPGAPNPTMQTRAHAKVALNSFTANPSSIYIGRPTTLSWTAYAATAYTVCDQTGSVVFSGDAGATSVDLRPGADTVYTLTVEGDTLDGPRPTASVPVTARQKPKERKEKDKDKERDKFYAEKFQQKEKSPRMSEELVFNAFRDDLPAGQDGTRRALLEPAERPDPDAPDDRADGS